jgi:hypothetical protein
VAPASGLYLVRVDYGTPSAATEEVADDDD